MPRCSLLHAITILTVISIVNHMIKAFNQISLVRKRSVVLFDTSKRFMNDGNRVLDWHKLPRLYHPHKIDIGRPVAIDQEDITNYILNVMRMKDGSLLRLFNPNDGEYIARLSCLSSPAIVGSSKKRKKIEFQLTPFQQTKVLHNRSNISIAMLLPIIKKDRFKWMIEKVTELGVDYIIPVITQNTNGENADDQKLWNSVETILIQACEQSERLSIPILFSPWSVKELCASNLTGTFPTHTKTLSWFSLDSVIVCRERSPDSTNIVEVLETWKRNKINDCHDKHLCIGAIIGPEGGWTNDELANFSKTPNFHFASLGSGILRSETAAVAAITCVSLMVRS